jgi:metal-sulfur cluster biosynthetic enzyme
MIDRQRVEAALATVYDPCSVQASAPLSVINMGLITSIDMSPSGAVRIKMRPTSAWCTMIGSMMQGIERQLRALEGVTDVSIDIDQSAPWSEADLTPEGREILGGVRARSRAAVPVRRRQWQGRTPDNSEV